MIKPDRLIIVAGVSCSGKSTVIRALKSGTLPKSAAAFPGFETKDWKVMRVRDLRESRQTQTIDRLIVHYDLTAQDRGNGVFPYLDELVEKADFAMVMTVVAPPRILYQRNKKRLMHNLRRIPSRRYWDTIKYRFRVLKRTRNPHQISDIYERWLHRTESIGVKQHWFIDASNPSPAEPKTIDYEAIRHLLGD